MVVVGFLWTELLLHFPWSTEQVVWSTSVIKHSWFRETFCRETMWHLTLCIYCSFQKPRSDSEEPLTACEYSCSYSAWLGWRGCEYGHCLALVVESKMLVILFLLLALKTLSLHFLYHIWEVYTTPQEWFRDTVELQQSASTTMSVDCTYTKPLHAVSVVHVIN